MWNIHGSMLQLGHVWCFVASWLRGHCAAAPRWTTWGDSLTSSGETPAAAEGWGSENASGWKSMREGLDGWMVVTRWLNDGWIFEIYYSDVVLAEVVRLSLLGEPDLGRRLATRWTAHWHHKLSAFENLHRRILVCDFAIFCDSHPFSSLSHGLHGFSVTQISSLIPCQ